MRAEQTSIWCVLITRSRDGVLSAAAQCESGFTASQLVNEVVHLTQGWWHF